MNIWWVNQHSSAPDQAGHTRNYSLAYYLTRLGHQVTLIASEFSHFDLTHRSLPNQKKYVLENINGVTFLWMAGSAHGCGYLSRLLSMFAFSRQCVQLADEKQLTKPDLIIGASPPLFSAQGARKLAKRLGVPFILEIQDIWPKAIMDLKGVSAFHPLMLYMRFLERKLYRCADGFIITQPCADAYYKKQGVDLNKVKYIPHGIDYELVPAYQPPIQKSKFVVVHAGKFAVANHLVTVLDAALILEEKYPDLPIEFWLIGAGVEKEALQAKANRLGISCVKFFSALPKAEIFTFMQQADALLLHVKNADVYRYGATTNRLFDYMACGRPIIYAFTTPYDPVSATHSGISVPSEDPNGIVEAAITLYRMPIEQRVQMGERGVAYVREKHNLADLAKDLDTFLCRFAK